MCCDVALRELKVQEEEGDRKLNYAYKGEYVKD
jgi:hypothetical protein